MRGDCAPGRRPGSSMLLRQAPIFALRSRTTSVLTPISGARPIRRNRSCQKATQPRQAKNAEPQLSTRRYYQMKRSIDKSATRLA
jgi:hypothetical protein